MSPYGSLVEGEGGSRGQPKGPLGGGTVSIHHTAQNGKLSLRAHLQQHSSHRSAGWRLKSVIYDNTTGQSVCLINDASTYSS